MEDQITKVRINLFRSLFKGREDTYGAGRGVCVRKSLTDAVILKHLQGKQRIGVYPLLRGDTVHTTHFAVVDIDKPDLDGARAYLDVSKGYGLATYLEVSKSKGFHIWHFFSEPVPAKRAKRLVNQVLQDAGLPQNTEVFPKQDHLSEPDSVGSYINLPLFGGDVPKDRTVFLNPDDGHRPYKDQWAFLRAIEKVSPDKIDELIESEEIEFEDDHKPSSDSDDADVADVKDEYVDMMPCVAKLMRGVSVGLRDKTAFKLAKHFRVEKRFPAEATLAILRMWNERNAPPLPDETIRRKVTGAYFGGKKGNGYTSFDCEDEVFTPFCDKNNCPIALKNKHKGTVGKYFVGKSFAPKRLADELMQEHSFIYSGELLHVYQGGVFTPAGEIFIRQRCRGKLNDAARINRINEVVAHIADMNFVETDKLNTYKHLVNVANGMLDWAKGILLPHDEKYLSTIRIPVIYQPQAKCPVVDYFFDSTLPADCIPTAEELFGYVLIPDVRFMKAFMLTGLGANGKSTFLGLLEDFTGSENVAKVPLQELDSHRFKRADIFGKLLNIFADLDERAMESSTYFKIVVGGDQMDAERKHKDPFYFRPFARLAFSANQIPRSPDRSFAYYRRWSIIPFPHQFVGDRDDKELIMKLTQPTEMSGLLNRALTGLRRLFEQGHFTEGETVLKALESYKRENDTVSAFIQERCNLGDPNARTDRMNLYTVYSRYCKNEGYKRESKTQFYNRIRAHTGVLGEVKGDRGKDLFVGIKLKDGSTQGGSQP